jgi:ATP-dependent protease ClpP protease subunit
LQDGNIFFLNDFDENLEGEIVLPLIRQIQHQRLLRDGRIDLHINSWGGYAHLVEHIISLVEVAKRDGIVVNTIVPAVAYSAGSMLAVAGTPGHRFIDRHAQHLVHYGTAGGSNESTPEQIQRMYDQKSRHFKRLREHYLTYTSIPEAELDRLLVDDLAFLTAAKVIKYGMADKYIDHKDFDIGQPE